MSSSPFASEFRVLGVCGGIGSGKSTACKILVDDLNCQYHIDADSVAHKVYEPRSPTLIKVAEAFGSHLVDSETGQLDRKALGAIVFSDPAKMAQLERIVWPGVKEELARIVEEQKQHATTTLGAATDDTLPIVILEAAVLLDAGWNDIVDAVWVVHSDTDGSLQRLMEKRNLSKEDATKRIEAQQTRRGIGNIQEEVANGVITRVIDNNGGIAELRETLQAALCDPKSWYSRKERDEIASERFESRSHL